MIIRRMIAFAVAPEQYVSSLLFFVKGHFARDIPGCCHLVVCILKKWRGFLRPATPNKYNFLLFRHQCLLIIQRKKCYFHFLCQYCLSCCIGLIMLTMQIFHRVPWKIEKRKNEVPQLTFHFFYSYAQFCLSWLFSIHSSYAVLTDLIGVQFHWLSCFEFCIVVIYILYSWQIPNFFLAS